MGVFNLRLDYWPYYCDLHYTKMYSRVISGREGMDKLLTDGIVLVCKMLGILQSCHLAQHRVYNKYEACMILRSNKAIAGRQKPNCKTIAILMNATIHIHNCSFRYMIKHK